MPNGRPTPWPRARSTRAPASIQVLSRLTTAVPSSLAPLPLDLCPQVGPVRLLPVDFPRARALPRQQRHYGAGKPFCGDCWGGWISDGDGGVILFWYDHRGAYFDGFEFVNNALYAQRVDRYGTVRWTPGGVLVEGPATGKKVAGIVNDGQGGCVIAWSASAFDFPGAQGREHTRARRISSTGTTLWDRILDSSGTQNSLGYWNIVRARDRLFFQSSFGTRILTLDGTVITGMPIEGFGYMVSETDSVVFVLSDVGGLKILKLDSQADTLWSRPFTVRVGCDGVIPFWKGALTPDGEGGIYYLYSCQDTIYHFDQRGQLCTSPV